MDSGLVGGGLQQIDDDSNPLLFTIAFAPEHAISNDAHRLFPLRPSRTAHVAQSISIRQHRILRIASARARLHAQRVRVTLM